MDSYQKSGIYLSVMASLTSILPKIAPTLGLTPGALYERQRNLVRMQLLPTPKGRGRGSGAEATPENVALLLIAVLASDNQSDVEGVQRLAFASYIDKRRDRCPLTGKQNFRDAMAHLLSHDDAASHASIEVSRLEPCALISFYSALVRGIRDKDKFSQFGHPFERNFTRFRVTSHLPRYALQDMRRALTTEI